MEHMFKQTRRVRFADQKSSEAPGGGSKERRIPLQKTPSFKEENKKTQKWFGRQISWQMNGDYDSNEIEEATAVAAAAYAVVSLTESSTPQLKRNNSIEPSQTRIKSRKEDKVTVSRQEPGESSMRSSEIQEIKAPETAAVGEKPRVKVVSPASSMKKTPTFTDKPSVPMKKIPTFAEEQLSRSDDTPPKSLKQKTDLPATKPETELPKPDWYTPQTIPEKSPAKIDRQTSAKPETGGQEVDSREGAALAKIKKKYDELEARILSWENKKKSKSRRRLDKLESELERKRLKGLERFHSEVKDINQIAEGARSKARKEQEKEELRAKEKANKSKQTGNATRTCFCF